MSLTAQITLETRRDALRSLVPGVLSIANKEKEALGFIPESAYVDAAEQERLLVAYDGSDVIGFILFGGVFPYARIQQIGVLPDHRRAGVGTLLMSHLIENLEREGFLSIKAKVATDLSVAQAFYAKLVLKRP